MVKNNSDSKWVFNKLGNTIIYHYERNHLTSGHLGRYITKALTYIFLFNLAFVFLYPFLFMVVTSLKSNLDLNDFTVNWVPRTFHFKNYLIAARALGYLEFFKNSMFVTAVATIGHMISCSFIGYGFARYSFPGKKILFAMVIIIMIVPIQTLIVPLYMIYVNLKWLNTFLPLIVPTFFGFGLKGALLIFIFRQFYLGFPKELEDAARIDGCGFLRTYWRIVLPVAQSAFIVAIVLSIVWHWNDFYEPSILASKDHLTTLPARLASIVELVKAPPDNLFEDTFIAEEEKIINNAVLMAGTFMVVLPVLVVFSFLQKKFMQGIEHTGIKS